MPAFRIKGSFLSFALIALTMLSFSSAGQTEDKTPAPWVGDTLAGKKCVGKKIGFGPYDYLRRAQLPAELDVVENAHFTPGVERLESGNTSVPINDIGYVLMAWPNHHRALHSAMKYRMMFWDWPEDAQVPPAECQLQRAIEFSPQDPVPYMMYGLLLHKAQQYEKALLSYRGAIRLRPDDILTQYNMGLTLVELKQYDEAVKMAKSAYAAGMPLPGLKNKLIEAGKWGTPPKATGPTKPAADVQVLQVPKKDAAAKAVGQDKNNAKTQSTTGDKQRVEPPIVGQ